MIDGPGRPPEAAADIFGARLDLAVRYAELLTTEAKERGLIGPREVPRIWDRHLINCAVVGELIEPRADVIDVGSGAGLPGLVLAIARPDLTVTLIEPLLRRSSWLTDVVERLALHQVRVRRARAEEVHGELTAQHVTARAVAPMTRLAAWCLPLVCPGGSLLAMKGRTAEQELRDAEATIRRLGGVDWDVVQVGPTTLADRTSVVQVRVGSEAPGRARSPKVSGRSRPVGSAGRRDDQPPRESARGPQQRSTERHGGGR